MKNSDTIISPENHSSGRETYMKLASVLFRVYNLPLTIDTVYKYDLFSSNFRLSAINDNKGALCKWLSIVDPRNFPAITSKYIEMLESPPS